MEVETAVRRHLLSLPSVTGYVQTRVFKYRLEEPVEGQGLTAIVINRAPGWMAPDDVQTNEFPRIVIDVVADPSRGSGGEVTVLDGETKAFAVTRVLIPALTYPNLRGVMMGGFGSNPGLLVNRAMRYAEPRIIRGGDMHPAQAGDTVLVRTEFAFDVAH